ncbi:unnamed protein product, partial [Haemonchus placei]|uniref:BPTI/Kunitz inhibitor domain-containing protein n=1 Tax=Haemonchus placei TaxID=6290 RepID=A0A0N4WG16_HAEPC
ELFCERPPNFGKGTYDKKASTCTIEYNFYTDNVLDATDFCEAQHPYSLKDKNRKGQKTICVISRFSNSSCTIRLRSDATLFRVKIVCCLQSLQF